MKSENNYIAVDQLRVGLYIHLDLGWMDHPFTLSNFKVKDEDQISKIKKIGLQKLRYDPNRSDCEPLPEPKEAYVKTTSVADNKSISPIEEQALEATEEQIKKKRHTERLVMLNKVLDENEKRFINTSNNAKKLLKGIHTEPKAAIEQAQTLINDMVDYAFTESEIAIHAMNGVRATEQNYVHSLNVTVLCMMLAKNIEMSEKDAKMLGMAALLHDIGKEQISDKVLMKNEPLTKSEQAHYEEHAEIGARMALEYGLPKKVASLILQHHEQADGFGYPNRLANEKIEPLARLLALMNGFDNLCNPRNHADAMTPYAALAHMFAHQRSKYDETLLRRMIKSLGVYPPGSIIQLSNGSYGIVISVNPNKPLRPYIMLHDAKQLREVPEIIDLREEPTLNIITCLKPSQLPPDVLAYLSPRRKLSYFLDKDTLGKLTSVH